MKQLLLIAFVLLTATLQAKNYYVSATGSNTNDGLTPATAWQTIAKVNSSKFAAGDIILFKRGDQFYGSVVVSANNLTFDAYGTGALPLISGYTTLTGWTNTGNGTWSKAVPAASTNLLVVTINNRMQRMGRYPNADAANGGYLNYETVNGSAPSITDNQLPGTPNWTGAEAVIRKQEWIIDRCRITAQSGGTLTYTNPTVYTGKAGYGYFIQDDIRTLDQLGEWFLNKSTKVLSIYFGSNNPASYSVKVSTVDTLFNCGGGASGYTARSSITVQNIAFEGANKQAFYTWNSAGNITVKNCTFNNNRNGIFMWYAPNMTSDGNIITNTLSFGIQQQARSLTTGKNIIQNNTVRNCALYNGMSGNGDGQAIGIGTDGDAGTLIQNNIVDSIGYNGINWQGSNVLVKNNYVKNFTMTSDDGGGIYTFHDLTKTNRVVQGNIVIGGIGAPLGRADNAGKSHSIYLDGQTANVQVLDNTISQTFGNGILCNNGVGIDIKRNTFYNVPVGIFFSRFPNTPASNLLRNDTITGNIIYPTTTNFFYWNGQLNQPVTVSIQNDMRPICKYDSNYYRNNLAAPFDYYYHLTPGGTFVDPPALNLSQWQSYINSDAHSKAIDTGTTRFEFNATNAAKTVSLDGNYADVYGTKYNGTITLAPYKSAVLIKSGSSNKAPLANAGTDKAITMPTNTATFTGAGTDSDGTISSYAWVKISGPSSGTIATANAATTAVNTLTQGVYKYQLTVTDNSGATGKDTVQLTVNTAANKAPVGNAGNNNVITLPTNTTTLTGSGSDPDGTVSGYIWTKISGPSAGTIATANAATTAVNNLVEGIYKFQLTITDNSGATGKDTVQVTVNAAANKAPVANSGTNSVITLPANTATLTGSGTDADGTISSYAWLKISGPSAGTIATANAATTAVNNLVEGIYKFQLTITDNIGATGKDTVQVTVNAAANKAPVANSGTNSVITLPANTATLTGSGTDADGTISSYAWLKISGPSAGVIATANAASTTISNLIQGFYQYQLTVTDNNGAIGKDTVQLTVNAAPAATLLPALNPANTVNGLDYKYYEGKWSVLPAFASLSAVKSGTIANFDITPADSAISFGFSFTGYITVPSDGLYTFYTASDDGSKLYIDNVLTVANDSLHGVAEKSGVIGLKAGKHAITGLYFQQGGGKVFTVSYAATGITKQAIPSSSLYKINAAPVANASADATITLPTNTIILTGSGSDVDGTIKSYSWVKIWGHTAGSIANSTSATTAVNGLIEGMYQFELTVTDNIGAVGKDTIVVIVNAAPAGNLLPAVNPANTVNGLDYKYYEGNWTVLPSFASLTAIKSGATANFDITLANRASQFGFSFTGYITVPSDGQYTFYTASDDGSKLLIDNVLVVSNDSLHGAVEKSGIIGLKAGKHAITGLFFQQAGGQVFIVSYAATGIAKQSIPASSLYRVNTSAPARVARGPVSQDAGLSSGPITFKVYPNPVMNIANLNISGYNGNDKISVSVLDLSGRLVQNKEFAASDVKSLPKLDMSNLTDGYYIIILKFADGQQFSSKVIKTGGK